MRLDGLQSGYMPNHKMDPAVVGSSSFGKCIQDMIMSLKEVTTLQ